MRLHNRIRPHEAVYGSTAGRSTEESEKRRPGRVVMGRPASAATLPPATFGAAGVPPVMLSPDSALSFSSASVRRLAELATHGSLPDPTAAADGAQRRWVIVGDLQILRAESWAALRSAFDDTATAFADSATRGRTASRSGAQPRGDGAGSWARRSILRFRCSDSVLQWIRARLRRHRTAHVLARRRRLIELGSLPSLVGATLCLDDTVVPAPLPRPGAVWTPETAAEPGHAERGDG